MRSRLFLLSQNQTTGPAGEKEARDVCLQSPSLQWPLPQWSQMTDQPEDVLIKNTLISLIPSHSINLCLGKGFSTAAAYMGSNMNDVCVAEEGKKKQEVCIYSTVL